MHSSLAWHCFAPFRGKCFWHTFTDRFIRGSFPSERKVVLWISQLVAKVARRLRNTGVNVINSNTSETIEAGKVFDGANQNSIVRVARQRILKSNTKHDILVMTKPSGLLTIQPRLSRSSRKCTLADRAIVDVSSSVTGF